MISAEQFLDTLQEKDLIPVPLIESLRKQVAAAGKPVSAQSVAKLLIDKGHLTPALANGFYRPNRKSRRRQRKNRSRAKRNPRNQPKHLLTTTWGSFPWMTRNRTTT